MMTTWARGEVALVLRGHDAGHHQTVVAVGEDGFPLLADGRRRKLAAPKRKNPKHLRPAGLRLEEHALATDRQLRRALHPLEFGSGAGVSNSCEKE